MLQRRPESSGFDAFPWRHPINSLASRHFRSLLHVARFRVTAHSSSGRATREAFHERSHDATRHCCRTRRLKAKHLWQWIDEGYRAGHRQRTCRGWFRYLLNWFRVPEGVISTRSQLPSQFGVTIEYSRAGIVESGGHRGIVEIILEPSDRLDIVVNNAGIRHVAPIPVIPVEKWHAILAVNLSSAFHTTRCALPKMERARPRRGRAAVAVRPRQSDGLGRRERLHIPASASLAARRSAILLPSRKRAVAGAA